MAINAARWKIRSDLDRFSDPLRVSNIAGKDLDALFHGRRGAVEPAPRAPRIVHHEGSDISAQTDELLSQVRADKAVRTGHQHSFSSNFHFRLTNSHHAFWDRLKKYISPGQKTSARRHPPDGNPLDLRGRLFYFMRAEVFRSLFRGSRGLPAPEHLYYTGSWCRILGFRLSASLIRLTSAWNVLTAGKACFKDGRGTDWNEHHVPYLPAAVACPKGVETMIRSQREPGAVARTEVYYDCGYSSGRKGVRLRPYTMPLPKPLMPVGDLPIIEVIIKWLRRWSVTKHYVTLGYHGRLIQAMCGDGKQWGVDLEYCFEPEPLGTLGSLTWSRISSRRRFLTSTAT